MISNKTEYLLFILMNLASRTSNEYVPSRTIAEEELIPVNYIPQLMAILTKTGWVESARGVNGGVRLGMDPAKITLQDVIKVSGDSIYIKKCLAGSCSFSHSNKCRLLPMWQKAQDRVEEVMAGVTIAELADGRLVNRKRKKPS